MTGPETPDAPAEEPRAPSPLQDDPGDETEPERVPPQETPAAAAESAPPQAGPFHVAGLSFQRNEEAGVVIRRHSSPDPNVTPVLLAILDRDTWCSVVAAVSRFGDSADSFQWAGAVHDGTITE